MTPSNDQHKAARPRTQFVLPAVPPLRARAQHTLERMDLYFRGHVPSSAVTAEMLLPLLNDMNKQLTIVVERQQLLAEAIGARNRESTSTSTSHALTLSRAPVPALPSPALADALTIARANPAILFDEHIDMSAVELLGPDGQQSLRAVRHHVTAAAAAALASAALAAGTSPTVDTLELLRGERGLIVASNGIATVLTQSAVRGTSLEVDTANVQYLTAFGNRFPELIARSGIYRALTGQQTLSGGDAAALADAEGTLLRSRAGAVAWLKQVVGDFIDDAAAGVFEEFSEE